MSSIVSLFSGCGGLDLGFQERGFDIVYACDHDPAAVDCYARNVDTHVSLRDVTSPQFHADIQEIGHCDVVLGGFPCQGFSKAGPKRARDTRNALYVEMKSAISVLHPHIFIAENVDGISQNFSGAYLRRIIEDFEEIGYSMEHRILDTVAFGLPQHRRRIFFVGVSQHAAHGFEWPTSTHTPRIRNGEFKVKEPLPLHSLPLWQFLADGPELIRTRTIRDAIGDLIDLNAQIPDHEVTHAWPERYETVFRAIKPGQKLCNVRHAATSIYMWQIPSVFGETSERQRLILETIGKNRRHKKYGNIPNGNPLPVREIEKLSGLTDIQADIDALVSSGYLKEKLDGYDLKGAMFCSGLFKRPRWGEPAPTILTNFHNPRYFLHPSQDRPFSLRECARLQGFPDTFAFTGPGTMVDLVSGYRLVGNAVPPPISRLFAPKVAQFLGQFEREVVHA